MKRSEYTARPRRGIGATEHPERWLPLTGGRVGYSARRIVSAPAGIVVSRARKGPMATESRPPSVWVMNAAICRLDQCEGPVDTANTTSPGSRAPPSATYQPRMERRPPQHVRLGGTDSLPRAQERTLVDQGVRDLEGRCEATAFGPHGGWDGGGDKDAARAHCAVDRSRMSPQGRDEATSSTGRRWRALPDTGCHRRACRFQRDGSPGFIITWLPRSPTIILWPRASIRADI